VIRQIWAAAIVLLACAPAGLALDPTKSLTQYSRKLWTQQHGLPQDTIRAITQTTDGYLWLGTDEGLARFDGYEFTTFDKSNGDLPSNSITSLTAGANGALWIGTPNGLTLYNGKGFRTFTTAQGLPDMAVGSVYFDHSGVLWVVAGVNLSRYVNGKFTTFTPGAEWPVASFRNVTEDRAGGLWIAGFDEIGKFENGKLNEVLGVGQLDGDIVTGMAFDAKGNLWVGGSKGILERQANGAIERFTEREGLPDVFVRAIWVDRDGSVWAGTNGGIARLQGSRFVTPHTGADQNQDQVRCMYEDREGDLWIGSSNGLTRLRDDVFTVYGTPEGLPSDEPNVVFQDHLGRVWVGFHDNGLLQFAPGGGKVYTTRDGLPNNEILSIRETANGELLVGTRGGLALMRGGAFKNFIPNDKYSRVIVFDALEDAAGKIWVATAGGVGVLRDGKLDLSTPNDVPLLNPSVVTMSRGSNGELWAGTYGKGLWRIGGEGTKLFTMADGLSNEQIRSLYVDQAGELWIGTYGGGLNVFRNGKFTHFTEKDGLLSDNVSKIEDDGDSLWLSTTRGICRIDRKQLQQFEAGTRKRLEPLTYGVEDGLRSAQCSPAYPVGGGGVRMSDGRLWFTTSRGLAVYDPKARIRTRYTPMVHVVELAADNQPLDMSQPIKLSPWVEHVQFRYTAIHLSAPELVRYSYQLEGFENEWVQAGTRRVTNYNTLNHGPYRFRVRAEMPGGASTEASFAFVALPKYYETWWFRLIAAMALAGAVWMAYQYRMGQIRARYAAVLEERARLAREIHDTLAQGFVGISSQLDAVAMCMPQDQGPARKFLDLARKMSRHSLTEARRAVMDLRASVLEGQDLAAALESGTRMWTAGSGVDVKVDVSGPQPALPEEMEQHLLRIAQEAVTNVVKHAGADQIHINLRSEERRLKLRISDNGRGFDGGGAFATSDGHFGLLGMRERAERLGGELRLESHPGEGTEVEVTAPLP
jgi:signal transduction histidine kinase/ligand-binding sensor domain-containing protein